MSWSYVDWCKIYIHLRSLNFSHFGMVAATALKTMASRSPLMNFIHKNLPVGSEVVRGTNTQTGW
jgi:hypothetical protein